MTVDAGPAQTRSTRRSSPSRSACRARRTCQTIDHIEVDTGSSACAFCMRASAGSCRSALPPATVPGGMTLAECLQFADGSSWGPIATGRHPAAHLRRDRNQRQRSGDRRSPGYPALRRDLAVRARRRTRVTAFGANGILGVGPFAQDCGPACADTVNFPTGWYVLPATATVNRRAAARPRAPRSCAAAAEPGDALQHRQQWRDRRAASRSARWHCLAHRRRARLRDRYADQ